MQVQRNGNSAIPLGSRTSSLSEACLEGYLHSDEVGCPQTSAIPWKTLWKMRKDVISANGWHMSSIVWYGWWDLDERIFCASGKTTSLLYLAMISMFQYKGRYGQNEGMAIGRYHNKPPILPFFGRP